MKYITLNKIQTTIDNIESISKERQSLLVEIAGKIRSKLDENGQVNIMFICTHNSRRSQLAQVLATIIADDLGLDNLEFYSGGTEATSFNYRMVNALLANQFELKRKTDSMNPVYRLFNEGAQLPGLFFSKKYDHQLNPKNNYIALMVCDHADENCPVVVGAEERLSLHYKDPKDFDDTEKEGQAYHDKIIEIRSELHFMLDQI